MSGIGNATATVTIRVKRFAPRPERQNRHASSALRKSASPFGSTRKRPRGKQWSQEYTLRIHPHDTVLDCLLTIKRTLDPTLAFRYSCGHGMCGSDAVAVNGTPTLLCTARVSDYAKQLPHNAHNDGFRRTATVNASAAAHDFATSNGSVIEATEHASASSASATDINADAHVAVDTAESTAEPTQSTPDLGVIELAPLPGFPVQRDLIADIDPMLDQIKRLQPYLQADGKLATTREGKVDVFEYLQKPEQLAKYELLSNCIACGVCEGSCPVFAGGEAFIGPAALVMASRFLNDSRDNAAQQRLDAIDTADGIAACQSVRACGRQCPRGIDVGEEMWQLTTAVRER
ncbi:succinate dehydrogenase/fumarate reductase iron-sulfur subunit [Bifidobacterium tibiigranuli]|jgi:succinate dehydrogenase / fumarate reductase iron-sulfur subunit|uniref:succinate dehydrogenase/fumarate reductase iron-sulfur subunit n=1 Tax=Bifidobacterium tibiigranuli TaxID=2172043 RepID=UPI0026F02D44|nr:2Fe-2S iron-sulfur cluster-binding protein [Bifidobacterium tibiigranuli]MCI1650725.1 2Fe-2S iron-sulfur cluster-binding protein [Bifidobacterium tibiigranuli]MCI2185735.1 2Fe-2S iron-sulfur cluster-binding protein [Bifidobacterium tibiigranuli]MCI2203046.1 2Fe-2S iron-sulfur cluster-binding protein [Bifidobacterium tibiigranuli]